MTAVSTLTFAALATLAAAQAWALDPAPALDAQLRFSLQPETTKRSEGLGLVMGTTGSVSRTVPGFNPNSLPRLDLGLQWRYTLDGNYHFNIAAWRQGVNTDTPGLALPREPVYGARVEMQLFGGSRSGFVADYGFIGLQFETGTRLMLRRKDGVPTLYLRTSF